VDDKQGFVMQIEQCRWQKEKGWGKGKLPGSLKDAQLVLFFSSKEILDEGALINGLKTSYPQAEIVGCTNEGQILGGEVTDHALVVTAIHFEHSSVVVVSQAVDDTAKSEELGVSLIQKLPAEGLRHVFALGDGSHLAGSSLAKGISSHLSPGIGVTGGFTPPNHRVYHNATLPNGAAVLVGLYGDKLQFSYAARTGWKSYGPIRKITKSQGEVLYELDNKPALDFYKEFLGPFANELPGIGLNYPMLVWGPHSDQTTAIARTVVAVDENEKSLRCAGDLPEGYNVQFMITNNEMIVQGAATAAKLSLEAMQHTKPELALLMTCVSRKMMMKQRIEEEVEAVSDVLGENVKYTGFYTWGEITPLNFNDTCAFQNQVMAITAIREVGN